ncbi:enoyl-CoA hydratase/isomerase family protein [Cryobacterium roopkundense]|uniref:2-(1,2-epoxy-1,2-dihydrophenyl)acetyl-CoA isomerase n=1 Tax=Cryobacterium roopkundense TaxID=1001240 RepID=A0A7W8ZW09_9MICO|nr:enoyl-CoA hydratase-related protein [Cryobacterium roopkundense]MBB5641025.1 2-(1,2-epoxy-1,2-dihydrophenyl)acetyl-CoA isomerase [Cryobacterium roopkundense]
MTTLEVDRPGPGVLRFRLNGVATLNALDDEVKGQLVDALRAAALDRTTRVVLLTGTGRAFCAGGDVRGMGTRSPTETNDVLTFGRQITEAIAHLQKPVVAAVNGLASGAGFNLALVSDIILAAPTAWFQQSFVRMGLAPDMGGTYLLGQAIGPHRAKAALMTGRRFSADDGVELGFVAEVLSGNFDDEAVAYCSVLARKAPIALGLTKLLANRAHEGTLADALDRESLAQALLSATTDHKRAVDAFLNNGDLDALEFKGE